MNIAIVDDEKIFLDIMLKKVDLGGHNVYTFTSVKDMEYSKRIYELLILDIEMPDYDGIKYSKEHPDQRVIFITNHSSRMKQAFMKNVYGFIEKSDDIDTINASIKSVISEIQDNETIKLKSNTDYYDFVIKDIAYIQYIGSKTLGIAYKNKKFVVSGYTLKELYKLIGDKFAYADRNLLINTSMILYIINNRIYIKGIKETFDISVRRRKELKELLMKKQEDLIYE